MEAIEPLLDAAEHALAVASGVADGPFEPSAGWGASQLANVPAAIALGRAALAQLSGDAEGAMRFGRRTLGELGEGERMLESITRGYPALAAWLHGELTEAERALSSAMAQAQAAGAATMAAWVCHHLGLVQRAQGRLDAATATYQQALEITKPPGQPALPAAGIAYVGLAEVAYQRGELDTALRDVTEGVAACRQFPYARPLATGLATLAWTRQADGDANGAVDAIEQAGRVAPGPAAGLVNPVPAQRARLLLAQGEVAAAARWTQEHSLGPDDDPGYPREPEYLVLARVLVAQDRPGPALALLDRMLAAADAQDRTGSVIEIQAVRALALAAAREEARAVDVLAGALVLACPQGYVRVFADEGPPMAALLARLVAAQRTDRVAARGVELGYLARVLRAASGNDTGPGAGGGARPAPGLVEQLTARELEVLALLAAGTPNPRIAAELVVTLDTVKKHVSHLLGKLGAANRTEAVTRARQLGLIP